MFRNIHVALSASSGNLRSVLAAGAQDVKNFEKSVESSSANTGKFAEAAQKAAKLGALTLAAGLAISATSAIKFDREMRNVNSISKLSEGSLQSLGRQTLAMSKDPFINQGPVDLAKGLYDVASSGFQGAQGLIVLRGAAEAASAGLTTTAVSGKAITAVLNAYGRSAIDTTDVSDVLFQTVNLGVVTFEELASQLGDVVGSAAAGKIPIEDVGAALAAMTLSGVSAAESATSLNQVIQAFIKPSDEMAATLKGLGYESGAAAIEQDGLYGVMEKLRKATGGQLTSMQLLFPEIRGLRGALALTAAEGANYAKTTDGIANAENRAGATRKALAEQMKAVGFQLEQMRNRATAGAIAIGSTLLPAIHSLINGLQEMGARAWPEVVAGFEAAMPLFRNLAELGMNLAEVAKSVIGALLPIGAALAAVAGGTVLVGLNALASVLGSITGFLADNAEIVQFLATLYTVQLVASVAKAGFAFAALALQKVAYDTIGLSGSVSNLVTSFSKAQAAAGGVAIALTATSMLFAGTERHAKEAAAEITKDMDLSNSEALATAIKKNSDAFVDLKDHAWASDGKGTLWEGQALNAKNWLQQMTFWTKNTVAEERGAAGEIEKNTEKMIATRKNAFANESEVAKVLGVSQKQVIDYAKSIGVDLTKSFNDSAEAREKVILSFQKMQQETGLSAEKLTDLTAGGVEKMSALQAAVAETAKAVGQAFGKATSIFDNTDLLNPEERAKQEQAAAEKMASAQDRIVSSNEGVADARQRVIDAEKTLAEARTGKAGDAEKIRDAEDKLASAREAAKKAGATPQELRAVANAERDLARARTGEPASPEDIAAAERDLAKSRRDLGKATADTGKATKEAADATAQLQNAQMTPSDLLQASFQEKLDITSAFVQGIGELTRRGLDPGLIKQLLEQGPKDAAPTIEALLGDHTGKLIGMANETEVQLQAVNARVVAFARLTQVAVSSSTDKLATDLPLAMKIAGQSLASEGQNTAEQIALAIGAPTDKVREVATAYGISIGNSITAGIAAGIDAGATADLLRFGPGGTGGHRVAQATGGIMRFAQGGLNAHFATSPTVLYGERSTGGEAYIPLGAQHRTRSTALWEETGRILGVQAQADGGVYPVSPARSRQAVSTGAHSPELAGLAAAVTAAGGRGGGGDQTVNLNVAAGIDPTVVRQAEHGARVAGWVLGRSGRR